MTKTTGSGHSADIRWQKLRVSISFPARGTVFLNAHCQGALCNSSRTSVMLSLRPSTTGIYGLAPRFRDLEKWRDRVSLPQYFREHGYHTATAGKVYHSLRPAQMAFEFDDI